MSSKAEAFYPTTSAKITDFLCKQWAEEFPEQSLSFPRGFHWEYRLMHIFFRMERIKNGD